MDNVFSIVTKEALDRLKEREKQASMREAQERNEAKWKAIEEQEKQNVKY